MMPSGGQAPPEPPDLLLAGTAVLDGDGLRPQVDVAIRGDTITAVTPIGDAPRAGREVLDYRDRLLIPGATNSHHHFATGLLRLRPAGPPTRHQRDRLARVIWPFERQLSRDDVRLAVQLGVAEAIRAGTTVVIDHHVSGGCIPGILDDIAEAVLASGLHAILAYEISDRDGSATAAAALAENERFLRATVPAHPSLHGMVGLHALSTVGPESLTRAVALAQRHQAGLHLHLAESEHDNADSASSYGARPVARLLAAHALDLLTLAAHAIHLTDQERDTLAERGVMVAHCPRSNAANGVGLVNLDAFHASGITVGLGGDGFTQDMRSEIDLLPLLQRHTQRRSAALPLATHLAVGTAGAAAIVERLTGWRTGRVAPGYRANLVGLRYESAVPLLAENALWHLGRGLPGAVVHDVWSGGRQLLRQGALLTLDHDRLRSALSRYAAAHAG